MDTFVVASLTSDDKPGVAKDILIKMKMIQVDPQVFWTWPWLWFGLGSENGAKNSMARDQLFPAASSVLNSSIINMH